jgi:hypothetical protein
MTRTSQPTRDWAAMPPWRRSQLRRAGFDRRRAAELAADLRYDVPAIVELVGRGCPPEIAARILAPDDRPGR